MSNWRDAILNDFVPNVSKLTLVADPDCLLTEEKLALELRGRGFDLIEFSDPVEFRYVYETKFRSIWDRGEHTDLVVVLRLQDLELESLPYDLLQTGRKLSFNLGDLFPNLSYPVVEKLDRSLFDALFEAQSKSLPDRMGDNATEDYILRHVFGIAAELINNEVDLLRMLLRVHYGNVKLANRFAERIVDVLQSKKMFVGWDLHEIVTDDEAFYAFLQERWPVFLEQYGKSIQTLDGVSAYNLKYSGPELLPFGHDDIKVYIDNLFLEGKLNPVLTNDYTGISDTWILSGVALVGEDSSDDRMTRLFTSLEGEVPTSDARYTDWISYALKWAELTSLVYRSSSSSHLKRFLEIGDTTNAAFTEWLRDHYSGLINLPPSSPAMLHHIPRRLARDHEEFNHRRVALIVVDGLSLDQWVTVRESLHRQNGNLVLRESAIFAWIPTLTSISRQAIFSGKIPLFFSGSINSTNSEENHWKKFWEDHGLSRHEVAYQRGLGDGSAADIIGDVIIPGKTKVVGLVVDKIDKIMHGMQLGSAGMHNQISQWCQDGFLSGIINNLLSNGFEVWLTSDHGNIECSGMGRPNEGSIAELRGERVRVYPTVDLRERVSMRYSNSTVWDVHGLPDKFYPLFASGRTAFVGDNENILSHGGISIEEVIVPLVKIEQTPK